MTARDLGTAMTDGEDTSDAGVLSPEETYEGSRRFTVCLDTELDAAATTTTAVISPALLARLRDEIREQAARDELSTRPTQRTMAAVRLGETRE